MTYYYELQEVERSGAINKLGPSTSAPAASTAHAVVLGAGAARAGALVARGRQLQARAPSDPPDTFGLRQDNLKL